MRYVHARERIRRGATAIVKCRRECQVAFMDDLNYNAFQSGKPAQIILRTQPGLQHKIVVPETNNWNIVLTYEGDILTLLDYEIGVKDFRLS